MPQPSIDPQANLELRSEPVQEIIGRDPSWIIRWGITVVFMTVIMILIGAWIIKYPEVVTARIAITTQSPPVRVVSRSSGKITAFLVEEGDEVKSDQYLAVLENTADYADILVLRDKIQQFQGFLLRPEEFLGAEWEADVSLGELQATYSDFLKRFAEYKAYVDDAFFQRKADAMRNEIKNLELMGQSLSKQMEIQEKEFDIQQNKYENQKSLYRQELISQNELTAAESQFLDRQYALEQAKSAIVNNSIRIDQLEANIAELEQQERDQRRQLMLSAQEGFKRLSSEFYRWEQTYILKSPADGQVSLFKVWADNQYVTMGDEVMVIIPGRDALVGKIYLPQAGAGKVHPGQEVHIKFDSYPYKEFGMVYGEVARVSPVARNDQYLVDIELPNGLNTVYRNELEFKHNMAGMADIITKDLRLIERIFNQFRYLFATKV